MRELLLLAPLLVTGLYAQTAVDLVVSVGHAGAPNHATFAGNYLVTASASNVALIDLASGITVAQLPQGGRVMSLEASPNGELLAVGTCDYAVQLWDLKSLTAMRRIALVQECADFVSFSPDGRIDGSERALATLVAWRTADRVVFNKALTDRRWVRRLWRSLPK